MKRVIIMGASSGIGFAVADALASRGVTVGIAARHTEPMRALQRRYPGMVHYASIDVTAPEAVERLNELIDATGGMDIYLHVAGIGYENLRLEPEREVEILNTNVCGFTRMVCAAYRWFYARGIRGSIVAITSVAGTNGIGRLSAYSASKAFGQKYLVALRQLSRAQHSGITITDVRPGWTTSPLLIPGRRYLMEMDMAYVVPQIIRAMVFKPAVEVIDWRWNILVGLWRLLPNCLWTRIPLRVSSPDSPLPGPPRVAYDNKNASSANNNSKNSAEG